MPAESTRADLVHAVLMWAAIAEEARAQAAAAREALERDAVDELATQGAAPTWRFAGLGTVPLATSTAAVVVDDERAYVKWLAVRYPDEVETVTRPRGAFDFSLRRRLAKEGGLVDDEGTVIPGLRYLPGGQSRGVSIRPEAGVRERLRIEARKLLGLPEED